MLILIFTFAALIFLTMLDKAQMVIPFKGLKEGSHHFSFKLNDTFFEHVGYSEISKGDVTVDIVFEKHTRFFELEITLNGWVEVLCDRCLEAYNQEIDYKTNLLVKIVSQQEANDDNIIFITEDEYQLELDHYLYESIVLSMPMKKTHPESLNGETSCNPEALEQLKKYSVKTKKSNDDIDPRWGKLKDLL